MTEPISGEVSITSPNAGVAVDAEEGQNQEPVAKKDEKNEKNDNKLPGGRNDNRNNNKRKRGANSGNPYQNAYRGFTFTPIESTGRPGTPHRYFDESYHVNYQHQDNTDNNDTVEQQTCNMSNANNMVVHKHVNGLVIVTAGSTKVQSAANIDFHVQPLQDMSAAQKRKQQSSMLRGKSKKQKQKQPNSGIVHPKDGLCTIHHYHKQPDSDGSTDDKTEITLPCCVWGSLVELNHKYVVNSKTPEKVSELMNKDPLLSGYLAVILPSGPFPPASEVNLHDEKTNSTKEATSPDSKPNETSS